MKTVITMGISSAASPSRTPAPTAGPAAIARAAAHSPAPAAPRAIATQPNWRTRRPSCRCSGVWPESMPASEAPMRPICVLRPVAVTSATPWPDTASVPARTHGCPRRREACSSGAAPDASCAPAPIRGEQRLVHLHGQRSRNTPSAGMRSPSDSTTEVAGESPPARGCAA